MVGPSDEEAQGLPSRTQPTLATQAKVSLSDVDLFGDDGLRRSLQVFRSVLL